MQKGLYLTYPNKNFVVVKKTGRGLYSAEVSFSIKSALADTLAVERKHLGPLIAPLNILKWSKEND